MKRSHSQMASGTGAACVATTMADLPPEMLLHIFRFVAVSDLQNASMTCRYLREFAELVARDRFKTEFSKCAPRPAHISWTHVLTKNHRALAATLYGSKRYTTATVILAIERGWDVVVQQALSGRASSLDVQALLASAIKHGNLTVINHLERHITPFQLQSSISPGTPTLLSAAVQSNRPEVLELLLQKANGLKVDVDGLLILCARQGHVRIAETLLKHGARVHAKKIRCTRDLRVAISPFTEALTYGQRQLWEYLFDWEMSHQ